MKKLINKALMGLLGTAVGITLCCWLSNAPLDIKFILTFWLGMVAALLADHWNNLKEGE